MWLGMQFVSNDAPVEDNLENQPVLRRPGGSHYLHGIASSGEHRDRLGNELQRACVGGAPHLAALVQQQCRICLDTGGEDLIAPCHCKGTQKYVHRSCLDIWRSTKEGFAFAHCTECRALFILRVNIPQDSWRARLEFWLLVAMYHTFVFVIVELVIASLGFVAYRICGEDHPSAFYAVSGFVVVFVGLLYATFIDIICGQRISERHNHLVAKQELTREYVVQDREVVSEHLHELGSAHVSQLRMMGLY